MTQESVEEHGWAIGIDFGTVNTRVAVFRNDRLEIIPDEDGNPSMASIVSFNDTSRLIGSRARSQLAFNPRNTIFNVKRLVGRRLNDPEVTADIHNFPFKVDELGRELAVVVEFKGETCKFAVMEIAAMILGKAKDNAEHYLGAPVTGAVVSVPAYWGTERRNAIFDAGRLSGLNILHLMPAPCASALAWEYYAKVRGNGKENICNILIYDLGGGTLNAALATIEVGVIELKAIAGDTELGGEDFLQRLVEDKVSEIKKSWGRNITSNRRSLQRLRTACERAITDLSSANSVHINVDSLFEGRDFHSLITRNRFRVLCQELTRDILRPIDRVLDDAKHDKSRLDEVLLVGGSSRIPQIRQILRDHLGVTPTKSISQDEAEVAGLAIWASMLSGALDPTTSELLILEVTPFSIGIDGGGGVFEEILPRNSTTPAARSRIFLMEPGTGYLYVYEGERVRAKNNTLLAKVDLSSSGLFASDSPPPADSKDPRFLLECTVDVPSRTQHAKLTVLNRLTGWSVTTPLHVVGTLDHETFVQRKERTLRLKEEDDMEAERFRALDTLEGRIASLIEFLHLTPSPASETAVAWAERVRDWVEGNQYASTEEYKEKEQVLDDIEKIFTFQKFEKARLESLKITVEDDLTVTPGHPAPPGRSSRDFESKLARQQDITKSLERIRSVLAAASLSSPTTREGKPREVEAQPARSPADIATAPPFSDDTPTVRPKAAQPSVDEEPPSEKSTTASEASAIQQARPPQHDSDSLGDLFARARGPAPEPFTDAQFERVSNFLRSTGNAAWAHVPRLYTVLRLIGQVDTMGFFLAQGINDIWFPFANGTLPPAMEPSAQTNFLESQTVVLSKGFRLEGDPDRRHVNFSGNDTLPFEVVARLGRGTHGSVNKIVSTISYRQYAQKVFRKARGLRREDVKSFITELGILKRVQHKHCIELLGSYSDTRHFGLIMSPVADCNLADYFAHASGNSDKLSLLRSFFGCLANALRYLHGTARVRHRDIKPQNILVRGDRVLLADFGIAFSWESLTRSTTTADSAKTLVYAAPEVARIEPRNESADVWSLGCVFLETAVVLSGSTVADLRSGFYTHSESYAFYSNTESVALLVAKLRGSGRDDVIVLNWVERMLRLAPATRPTTAVLFDDIVEASTSRGVLFCGPCCHDDAESSATDDEHDEHLWEE